MIRRVITGDIDSRTELEMLARTIGTRRGSRDRFAFFILGLEDLRVRGFAAERAKWIDTHRPDVKVFTGRGKEPVSGPPRIWAAVSLGPDGQLHTLLKSSDGYRGAAPDYWARLADAIDRHDRGRIEEWKP